MKKHCSNPNLTRNGNDGEQGFMLVGLIVAIFLVLLALSVAAPKVAQNLRREKEVEAIHRGNQYVRALRLYYRKTGMYPGSMEQLEKSNNIRYLRQRYVDPITGKADWRLIHVGEAKTTVKGFFGQPLAGLTTGLGSAAGMVSPGAGGAGATTSAQSTSAFGSPGTGGYSPGGGGLSSNSGSAFGSPGTGGGGLSSNSGSAFGSSGTSSFGSSSPGTSGANSPSTGSGAPNTLGSAAGMASSDSGTGMPSGGAPFVGVGIPKEGSSITVLNEQTTYNTWEFLYDPRIEQLYAKGSLLGGAPSTGLGGSGSSNGTSGFGATTPGFGNTAPTSPGFGAPPGTAPPGTSTPTNPTTPPQQD
jgi:type II secretory pathway pseudopilin PulG